MTRNNDTNRLTLCNQALQEARRMEYDVLFEMDYVARSIARHAKEDKTPKE